MNLFHNWEHSQTLKYLRLKLCWTHEIVMRNKKYLGLKEGKKKTHKLLYIVGRILEFISTAKNYKVIYYNIVRCEKLFNST